MLRAIAILLLLQAVRAGPQPEDRLFSASGYVQTGRDEDGGWFQFMESPMRFRLPSNAREADGYRALLLEAARRGVAIRVRYDGTAGRASADGPYVEYPLCSIAAGTDARFGDEMANCPLRPEAMPPTGASALGLGLAQAIATPAEARRTLGIALADPNLAPALRALALEHRGRAAEAIANVQPMASEAYDRAMVDALADFRGWVAAAPDNPDAQISAARAIGSLGGYEEAHAIYRAIGQRWPYRADDVAVYDGALYRRQGRYTEALAALDDLAAREGRPDGMRYSYHRAWTLQLLGRADEAVAELDRGLATQPDYPYALLLRSCAHARRARFREAAADQARGLELLSGWAMDGPQDIVGDLARGQEMLRTLRRLADTGSREPTDAPCSLYWARDSRARSRSALLGPAH